MARKYDNEYEWSKEKYEPVNARIDKKLGIELKEQLKNDGKSVAQWISENAKKYLKK